MCDILYSIQKTGIVKLNEVPLQLSNRYRALFPCLHIGLISCHLNTRRLGRIQDCFANKRRRQGWHNFRESVSQLLECFIDEAM